VNVREVLNAIFYVLSGLKRTLTTA
jgi:hypothetical protein